MTYAFRTINTISIILLLTLMGCGSSNDSELSTNLISTFPIDKSIGVSVNTSLELTYGQEVTQSDLDALEISLSVSTVDIDEFNPVGRLRYVSEQDIFKSKLIPFDTRIENNKIIITPSNYLDSETLYQLSFGNNLISFETLKNKPRRMVSSFGTFAQAETEYYNEFEYSENKITNTRYRNPGADETWFTEDDEVNEFTIDELDGKQRSELTYYYTNSWAGGYGDPNFSSVTTYERSEAGQIEQSNYYTYSIPYAYPYTPRSDENPRSYNLYTSGNGYVEVLTYSQSGDDQVWFTFDDVLTRKIQINFNSDGQVVGLLISDYWEGEDTEWGTADDTIEFEARRADYDSNGRLVKTYDLTEAGIDNTWFTEDDLIEDVETYLYENDLLKSKIFHQDAGLDETWFTGDDEIFYVHGFEYNSNGQYTSMKVISAGEDEIIGTQDDVEVPVRHADYNEAGLMISSWSIAFSGSFNSDNFYLYEIEYAVGQ